MLTSREGPIFLLLLGFAVQRHDGFRINIAGPRVGFVLVAHLFFNLFTDHPYDIPEKIDVRLIDFERLKKLNQRSDKPIQRDLFTLHRRGLHWPNSDRVWFLKNYLEISKLTPEAKTIIREFQKRAKKKLR